MPRRYHSYPPEFQVLNVMSTAGASILALGYLLPMIYLTWSLRYGKVAGPNPWPATGLEWTTAFTAAYGEFPVTPEVTWEPYDFHNRPDLGLNSRVCCRRRLTETIEGDLFEVGARARLNLSVRGVPSASHRRTVRTI